MAIPPPGRPFATGDILEAMRTSRRPGGVPDQLETEEIAAAVAEELWTFGGEAWYSITASASCGSDSCTLELAGAPPGSVGDDLYVLSVVPETGTVELLDANLRGLPTDLLAPLDQAARAARPELLADLVLLSAAWLPPPAERRFALAYRSGGEEGSCGVDVTLDAAAGVVIDATPANC